MRREPAYLPQCSNSVSVMAANNHRESYGETNHLDRRVVGVGLFSGSRSNEAGLLIIVRLCRLHISHAFVAEKAEHLVQVVGARNMVAIKSDEQVIIPIAVLL